MKIIKIKSAKKFIILLSLLGLMINATPLLAWTIDVEIYGGGYKIDTASVINFPEINSSTSDTVSNISFRDSQDPQNYIMITDENGNNPYDVTVTGGQLKKEENFSSTVASGSTGDTLVLANASGLIAGDTVTITGMRNQIYTVTEKIADSNIVKISPTMTTDPAVGSTVSSIVNCDISPKKCISLNNFKIMSSDPEIINGSTTDFSTAPYQTMQAFGGESVTAVNSTGNTLKLENPSVFQNNESIDLIAADGSISNYLITAINADSVSVDPPTIPDGLAAGLKVRSSTSRALTLAKGTGGEPGQFKIYPTIEASVKAGQKPGKYISTLYLSIF